MDSLVECRVELSGGTGKLRTTRLCWQSSAKTPLLAISLIYRKLQGSYAHLAPPCPSGAEISILDQRGKEQFP